MDNKKDGLRAKRNEKLAKLLLFSKKRKSADCCPIADFLEKSFVERVLWLEDQSHARLDALLQQCEMCPIHTTYCHPLNP
ncbi:MAG: hypothetical protein LBH08_00030 [Puniceicoccales bacterium]|jgi:hypothetical protein|nr:hypothetical protein [Puniceicoccales bacterium]